jgi:hypothetical protein
LAGMIDLPFGRRAASVVAIFRSEGRPRTPVATRLRIIWRLPILRRLRCLAFRRLQPLAGGRQRGLPIVRYYWAEFLEKNRCDIRGRCLEVGATGTIRGYGGTELTAADGIDLTAHSPEINVVADLARADDLAANVYDCFVNQFTMHIIYDLDAAIYHSFRLLKPGGVLLANFSSVDYCFRQQDMGTGAPLSVFWQFTPAFVESLLRSAGLSEPDYELEIYGNLFSRIAYQLNMPAEELTRAELDAVDEGHPLLICVRAVKPPGWNCAKPNYKTARLPERPTVRWNPITGHYAGLSVRKR